MNSITGLTDEEQKCMDNIVAAFNSFSDLKRQHPNEMEDFTFFIHRLQDQLSVRVVRRLYPKGWPTYEPRPVLIDGAGNSV